MLSQRVIQPEILDSLPSDDPSALRSRRDLRMINAFMGNFQWVEDCLKKTRYRGPVFELGAGEGILLERLHARGHSATGLDLVQRPEGLTKTIHWHQGNFLQNLNVKNGAVIATLTLHHFDGPTLERLGRVFKDADLLILSEPWRSAFALCGGYALFPLVNRVTRHDMIVSIKAGFAKGELPGLLGLNQDWKVHEEVSLMGACRLLAQRS